MTEKEKKLPIPPSLPKDGPRPRLSATQARLRFLKGTTGVKNEGDRPPKETVKLREEAAFNLRVHGFNYRQIAKKIGVKSTQTAFKAVQRASNRLSAEWSVEQHQIRHEHYFAIDNDIGELNEVIKRAKKSFLKTGDKAFLSEVRQCIAEQNKLRDKIREMMGANAPAQVHVQNDVSITNHTMTRDEMFETIRQRLAEQNQRNLQPSTN